MTGILKLRRLLEAPARPAKAKEKACEICAAPLAPEHGHVIDLDNRRMMCTCRPCYLLFTHTGAAQGKFRSVPQRYLRIQDLDIADTFDIPVGVVFFLRHSGSQRVQAFYPSPAGATESGLPIETWDEMASTNPALATIEEDVEALLIARRRGRDGTEVWIVPVDACYELVGRIRRHWKGFEGGEEAWRKIDDFFAALAEREAGVPA
jgi:hypothetical protein